MARIVNSELVGLYWDIGTAIREKQAAQGWGDGVVERLASDLKRAFPATTGFSAINLWRMRQLPDLHIHLIPRYPGDRPDPHGGVRWVMLDKADYWTGRN